jgi:hypothetical protein
MHFIANGTISETHEQHCTRLERADDATKQCYTECDGYTWQYGDWSAVGFAALQAFCYSTYSARQRVAAVGASATYFAPTNSIGASTLHIVQLCRDKRSTNNVTWSPVHSGCTIRGPPVHVRVTQEFA